MRVLYTLPLSLSIPKPSERAYHLVTTMLNGQLIRTKYVKLQNRKLVIYQLFNAGKCWQSNDEEEDLNDFFLLRVLCFDFF